MRRPRHREKSSLLWKMLGVAGLINLLLWPVLIHEGLFAGIRQEILIPVRLVSLPPSHKQPDALQKVARAVTPAPTPPVHPAPPAPRTNPKPPRAAATPASPPVPHAPAVTLVATKNPAPPKKSVTTAKPAAPTPQRVAKQTAQQTSPVRVAKAKPPPPVDHSAPNTQPKPAAPARAVPTALELRVARARQQEAEGHRVAEWIAQQRATRVAALPPPSAPLAPVSPTVTETTAVTPGEAGRDAPKIALTAPTHQDPPRKAAPSLSARLVPPIVVRKAYPVVPDAMMKSTWRAAFRGRFTVHADGAATVQMTSSTGFPSLDRRAMEAARRWKFRPALQNGRPVTTSQAFAFVYDVHPVR